MNAQKCNQLQPQTIVILAMMYEEIYSYFISVMEQGIFDAILSSPLVIVNQVLQIVAFAYGVTQLLSFMFFRLTGLSFITQFTFNSTIKIITVLVFWYSKNFIWEIAYFQLLHYVSEAYLSIYVFDTCCNFNDDYFKWSQTKKERALFLSIISAAVALFSFVKMFKFETESPLQYQYFGLFFLLLLAVVIANILKGQSVFMTFIVTIVMSLIVLIQHFGKVMTANTILGIIKIPFQQLFIVILAFLAGKRQRDALIDQVDASNKRPRQKIQQKQQIDNRVRLLASATSISLSCRLNSQSIPIELMIGLISATAILLRRVAC